MIFKCERAQLAQTKNPRLDHGWLPQYFAILYLCLSMCLFCLLRYPSGHFHQRGSSKHLTVLTWYVLSNFHQIRKFYRDFGQRCSGFLWDLPDTQGGERKHTELDVCRPISLTSMVIKSFERVELSHLKAPWWTPVVCLQGKQVGG